MSSHSPQQVPLKPPQPHAPLAYAMQDGLGSRTAVEPVSCMLACEAAPGCDSFAYNPAQKKCFLKAGATRRSCAAPETVCVSARGKPYSCGRWQTFFRQGGAAPAGSKAASPPAAPSGGQASDGGTWTLRPASVQAFGQRQP